MSTSLYTDPYTAEPSCADRLLPKKDKKETNKQTSTQHLKS